MSKIKLLTPDIIAKIAAGEVIERPAYAVKELIENAVDAHAQSIKIDIENSGLQKITVIDDGEGMSKDDIKLCFLNHSTSKINSIEDLNTVTSMGFRGEALASIAAISTLIIKSKPENQVAGTMVELESGKVRKIVPIGMPMGTTITIRDLFSTVPARHKFLKSLSSELRSITSIIMRQALAYPSIRFTLVHNGSTIIDFHNNQDLSQRVKIIFGDTIYPYLIPIQFQHTYFKMIGFIAKPQITTRSATKQYIFVNKRSVSNKVITSAVKEAFGTLLEPTTQPVFMLGFEIPVDYVDVNVHPRKEEIKFHNDDLLRDFVTESIQTTLSTNNLTFKDKRWTNGKVHEIDSSEWAVRDGSTATYAAGILKDKVSIKLDTFKIKKTDNIVQLHNLYIVIQTENGFILIDQHAAHERILYEQFCTSFIKEKKYSSQYLLPRPLLLDISLEEKQTINDNLSFFEKLGFSIDFFGLATLKIITVPLVFKDRNILELVREMIDDLEVSNNIKDIDIRSERMLSYLACRSAIKAGDILTKKQMKDLIRDLQNTKTPFTCPHGRPTQYEISLQELHKIFRRK